MQKPVTKMREGERVEVFGGEVHSDVWGLAPVESKGGKRYYVTFIDDKSHLTMLYLLHTKDKVPCVYKLYEAWVETQMGIKLKVLNSDRGGEYQGTDFVEYLKSKGTVQKLNVDNTPQHACKGLTGIVTLKTSRFNLTEKQSMSNRSLM